MNFFRRIPMNFHAPAWAFWLCGNVFALNYFYAVIHSAVFIRHWFIFRETGLVPKCVSVLKPCSCANSKANVWIPIFRLVNRHWRNCISLFALKVARKQRPIPQCSKPSYYESCVTFRTNYAMPWCNKVVKKRV